MRIIVRIVAAWMWVHAAVILLFGDYKAFGALSVLSVVALVTLVGYGMWRLGDWRL